MSSTNQSALPKLTHREMELVCMAFQCMSESSMDWERFTKLAGFKNIGSARATFRPTRLKLHSWDGSAKEGSGTTSTSSTPVKRKRPRKDANLEDNDDDDDEPQSATKRNSSSKRKAKGGTRVKQEPEEDEEYCDDD
ncbi:hypothetical protein F4778DRAFT_440180 [Xylariomycetidae sp. FL2044]|nr:hypothetical protein F4778DRAFT_440180 [Xylariomycetidae sp. FL2044]